MSPASFALGLALLATVGPVRSHRFAAASAPSTRAVPRIRPGHLEPPSSPRPADRWIAEDKLQHFSMSFAITAMSYGAARTVLPAGPALATAGTLALGAGIGKEIHDRRAGRWFSLKDLAWDAAGVALGLTLAQQIR